MLISVEFQTLTPGPKVFRSELQRNTQLTIFPVRSNVSVAHVGPSERGEVLCELVEKHFWAAVLRRSQSSLMKTATPQAMSSG